MGNGTADPGALVVGWTLGLGMLGAVVGVLVGASSRSGSFVPPYALVIFGAIAFGAGGAGIGLLGSLFWLLIRRSVKRGSAP